MGGRRVLVIEDQEDLAALYESALSKEGYEVSKAYTGEEGVALFEDDGADAVVLDMTLPEMHGVQTLKTIRDLNANVPVVVVFFITEAQAAAVNMMSVVSLNSLPPAMRCRRRPTRSTTPVFTSPPVRTKSPAMVMTMSLPKPANASETLSVPVSTSPMTRRMVTTSIGIRSVPKRTSAMSRRTRTVAMGCVMCLFCYNPATA